MDRTSLPTGAVPRPWRVLLAVLAVAASGCGGEPEPLRPRDPAELKEPFSRKFDRV
jgi:hypothetical protein